MTEALKVFIERNIDLIEDRKFEELYDNIYDNWLNNLGIHPIDIRDLTATLTEVFGKEPILNDDMTHIPAFYNVSNNNIEHLEIPEGIESIGKCAYKNCRKLQSVNLPRTLSEINYEAFKGCDELHSIFYNGSITEWNNIKIAFGSSGWIYQDITVYCNDGEITV